MEMDWSKFLTVDEGWVSKLLSQHEVKKETKLTLRTYSIKFSGQVYETIALTNFVINSIRKYVLSQKEIDDLLIRDEEPFLVARDYFGGSNPDSDGKYGELILYLLTEAILKVPLIAYKMPTNPNDQIKGGDGVFCGDYENSPAILIGEAKTWQDLSVALKNAFDSINKLYTVNQTPLTYEYFVAKRSIRPDMTAEELDYLYSCFSPGTEEYVNRNKVHPILIIYDNKDIKDIGAVNASDGESKMKALIDAQLGDYIEKIKSLQTQYSNFSAVNLDFFFLPLESVKDFRSALYKKLHGVEWRPIVKPDTDTPKAKKAASKKKK